MENKQLTGKNNYPEDIFTPLSDFELECVGGICKKVMGYPLDRLSAQIARKVIAARIEEERSAMRLIEEEIQKLVSGEGVDGYADGLRDALRIIKACMNIGETKDDNSKADIQRAEQSG